MTYILLLPVNYISITLTLAIKFKVVFAFYLLKYYVTIILGPLVYTWKLNNNLHNCKDMHKSFKIVWVLSYDVDSHID